MNRLERYKITYPPDSEKSIINQEFVRVPELNETLIERGKLEY